VLCVYFCVGSVAAAKDKEVGKPQVSSTVGEQVSAPCGVADVAENDDESSEADGWDDAWDDEEKWGDMEVRMCNIYCLLAFTSADTVFFTFTYHTWQFIIIIFTIFTITTCIFSYSFSLSL